jgi:hypothetical protein
MFKEARLPFKKIILNKAPETIMLGRPDLAFLWGSPETLVPVVEDPGCYEIAVVGGVAGRGTMMLGAGAPVTKPVTE